MLTGVLLLGNNLLFQSMMDTSTYYHCIQAVLCSQNPARNTLFNMAHTSSLQASSINTRTSALTYQLPISMFRNDRYAGYTKQNSVRCKFKFTFLCCSQKACKISYKFRLTIHMHTPYIQT